MWFIPTAQAHVRYVVEDSVASHEGVDWQLFLSPLQHGSNVMLIAIALLVIAGIYLGVTRVGWARTYVEGVLERADAYGGLIAWMLRLSVGIALIGAGLSSVLISPLHYIGVTSVLAMWQVALGFLLMVGLGIAPASVVLIGLFLITLSADPYLFGNMEMLAAAVSILLLGESIPGLDHLLGIPMVRFSAVASRFVPLVLRIGLGISFIYLAISEKALNPHLAQEVVTQFGLDHAVPVSPAMWVFSTTVIECALGIMLLFGWYARVVAVVAFAVLSASFFFFGESVYSHITLFGTLSVLFITGSGPFSVDALARRRQHGK